MSEDRWMPIESAPKDGSEVLLYGMYGGRGFEIGWFAGWWTDGSGRIKPTHWQPLPEPPEES